MSEQPFLLQKRSSDYTVVTGGRSFKVVTRCDGDSAGIELWSVDGKVQLAEFALEIVDDELRLRLWGPTDIGNDPLVAEYGLDEIDALIEAAT